MTTLGHSVLVTHNLKMQTRQGQTAFNNAIEVYVYRVASLVANIALLNGTHTVNSRHLQIMTGLWNSAHKQRGQRGGESATVTMPSDFYGYTNPGLWNGSLNTNSDTINFDTNTGRAAIEITGGSCCTTSGGMGHRYPALGRKIREYLTVQKIKIPQEVLSKLMMIVAHDIHLLVHKLGVSPVSDTKLSAVINSKRFTLFV